MPEPRWATRRRPERPTFGHRLVAISEKLRQPLMPFQKFIALTGCELLEDGRPAYTEIVMSVPRQCGKTTLILCWEIDRALNWRLRQRIIYSAQTGRDAAEKLLEDQYPLLVASPFKAAVDKPIRQNGKEAIIFKGGSRISVVASGESAGHGKTIGLGVIDEAFDDVDNRREQALTPAGRTHEIGKVPDFQMIVASTMGTDASIYLNTKIDGGRAIATEDRDDSRTAYFEWSAPDDADIADPRVWAACTPALGYTIDLDTIRGEYERNLATPGEFKRFALNQRTASDERVIPSDVWDACCGVDVQPDGNVVFALDCNPERSMASVAVGDPDGRLELLDHDRGTGWLVPRLKQLAEKWSAPVAVDPAGPAGAFIPQLESAGVKVVPVGGQDFTKSVGAFYDQVTDGKVSIRTSDDLNSACAAAKKRPVGDAWVWARKTAQTDISPLVAVTLALWAAQNAITGPSEYISLSEV